MAKTPDTEKTKRKFNGKEAAAWILMAMLILGLGGFGVTSFGGGVTSIGKVGTTSISSQDYARALQQEVDAFSKQIGQPVSTQEALALGIDQKALQGLVTRTALDDEAHRLGLSVGDAAVAAELTKMDAFKGAGGSFDREAYKFALDRSNMNQANFETNLRRDISRSILQGAVTGGFTAPAAMTDTLYAWIGERRGFSLLRLTEADLTAPIPEPTETDLKTFYDANIAMFTKPEAKRITFAALLPEAIAQDQPIDEDTLKKMYQDRISEFVMPERRLVERLVFPDQAAADAAKARLDAGTPFETLVTDRGLTLDAIDLGDVSQEDLGQAGGAVFALAAPGVAGPVMSDLGPALFRVNTILAADETSFDDARAQLAAELQTDAARRTISDKVETIDDLLAGGAEVKDLEKEAGMAVTTLDYVPGEPGDSTIEGYSDFRSAAEAIKADDFPEAIVLEDGGVVALHLDKIVPASAIPFDEARAAVAVAWHSDQVTRALSARAVEIKALLDAGTGISTLGIVDVTPEIARDGTVHGAPTTLLPAVFEMKDGDVRVIEDKDFVGVVRLDRVQVAVNDGPDAMALKSALAAQIEQALSQDAFVAYTASLAARAGISLDQAAINAVHASYR